MAPVSRRYWRGVAPSQNSAGGDGLHPAIRDPRPQSLVWLKVVVLNVLRGELQRLTGNDLSGGIDLIFTRPLSVRDRKRVAGLSLNLSFG